MSAYISQISLSHNRTNLYFSSMKAKFTIILFLLLCSCQNLKKQTADEILKKEKQSINWSEVDVYPSFKGCEEGLSKKESFECFTKNISHYINLNDCLSKEIKNTQACYQLHMSILKNGEISFDSLVASKPEVSYDLLSKQIDECIRKLEPIFPAQKRSVPVKLSFEIALQFKSL